MECQFCKWTTEGDYSNLLNHLYQFHNNAPGLLLKCNMNGCSKTFRNFSSRRSHISRNHLNILRNGPETSALSSEARFEAQDSFVVQDAFYDYNCGNAGDEASQTQQEEINLKTLQEAQFLMSLRADKCSQPLINNVVKNTERLVKACVQDFRNNIESAMTKKGENLGRFLDVDLALRQSSSVFSQINTKFKQDSFFRKEMCIIPPKKMLVNPRIILNKQANLEVNRQSSIKYDTITYVSVIEVIKQLMNNPDYASLLNSNEKHNDNSFHDYRDGSRFKSNVFLKTHPEALHIILYYDDVNLVDTASSRPTGMAYFYFTLGNIHPRYRSSLNFIFLALAVEVDVMKVCGMDEILEPLISDLKLLEKGIEINGEVVYGTLIDFLGDNLATHKVGGFKQGFTAKHPCRYCLITLDELRVDTRENDLLIRNPASHDQQVTELLSATDSNVFKALSEKYGLNAACSLNELEGYHIIGGTPPDILHDHIYLQLGKHLQLLLRHYLIGRYKIMNITDFNERLMEHDYGYNETKPSQIDEAHLRDGAKLHQTGAQMWTLAITMPFVIGPKIAFGDENWRNYIDLLEISSIVCAVRVSVGMVEHLYFFIEKYYNKLLELYPGIHLLPKQHYLLHYPRIILEKGPLYQFNTFRYEAKHQYFKDLMRKLKCLKNPAFTSANSHQLKLANFMNGPLKKPPRHGPIVLKSLLDVDYAHIMTQKVNVISLTTWVEMNGITYKAGECFVMLDYVSAVPKFGFLKAIVNIDGEFKLVCKLTQSFPKHLHLNAYEVKIKEDYLIVGIDDLYVHMVFFGHVIFNSVFIVVKRIVGDFY